jgi:hypothetical protein
MIAKGNCEYQQIITLFEETKKINTPIKGSDNFLNDACVTIGRRIAWQT